MKRNKTFKTGAMIALATLMASGSAFAQNGIAGGQAGLHQINANTLGQWNVSFGIGGAGTADNWSMTGGGILTGDKGENITINETAITADANIGFALGVTDWLDLGVNLPMHFDYGSDQANYIGNSSLAGVGIGDMSIWAKLRILGGNKSVFTAALLGHFYIPTGDEEVGLRPRHTWYLDEETMAYSSGYTALGGGLLFTLDLTKYDIPIVWNGQASYIHSFDDNPSSSLLYSTGVNITPFKSMDFFLEFSGEMRLDNTPYEIDPVMDPMLITPGVRFHLNKNMDLALGVDLAARVFKNITYDFDTELRNGKHFIIKKIDDKDREVTYRYASTPLMAVSASMTWRFGGVENDEPNIDSLIQARAQILAKDMVDSILGRVDTIVKVDTLTRVDTLAKVDTISISKVDTIAIAKVDTLKVIDSTALLQNQAKMDSIAAESAKDKAKMDSIANAAAQNKAKADSIEAAAALNKAKADSMAAAAAQEAAKNQAKLDSLAKLSADDDKDGVPNMVDKCPGTPAGIKVTADGCEVDSDNDGVPDSQDQCANSNAGAAVDANGCELDEDNDGIVDAMDKCPATLSDVNVDDKGCPTNKDEDLSKLQTQVSFKKGTARINKKSNKSLDKVAKLMIARPALRVEIQGHCDEMKTPEDNQEMSVLRAQAVVDYLVGKGVPSKYVRAAGFGDTKLLVQPKMNKKGKKIKSNPKNNRIEYAPHVKQPKKKAEEASAPAAAAQAAAPQAETQVAPAPAAEAKPATAPAAAPAKEAPKAEPAKAEAKPAAAPAAAPAKEAPKAEPAKAEAKPAAAPAAAPAKK